jgi:hypothetical protein
MKRLVIDMKVSEFELRNQLSIYIPDEILQWQLTFTGDSYKEVFRL